MPLEQLGVQGLAMPFADLLSTGSAGFPLAQWLKTFFARTYCLEPDGRLVSYMKHCSTGPYRTLSLAISSSERDG